MTVPDGGRHEGPGAAPARRARCSALALVLLACACSGGVAETPVGVSSATAARARFDFDSLDARPVSARAMAGKPAVLAFITTWDLASQAEVSLLAAMARADAGRVGYAAVVLGERADREMAEHYRDALAPPFPMALADLAGASSAGFGEVRVVPVVVVLDGSGRVVLRRDGLSKPAELRPAIRLALSGPGR